MDAVLAGFAAEYTAAIAEGKDVRTLLPVAVPSPLAPSKELFVGQKLLYVSRSAFNADAFTPEGLPLVRAAFNGPVYASYAGLLEVPATRIEVAGVPGHLIAWPGVNTAPDAPILISLHAGAYVLGTGLFEQGFLARESKALNIRVLAVDYPLAPEHSIVSAVAAVVSVYRHLITVDGVKPRSVILAGQSAGGHLALLVAQAILKAGLPNPAAVWSVSGGAPTSTEEIDEFVAAASTDVSYDPDLMGPLMKVVSALIRQEGREGEVPRGHPDLSPLCGPVVGLPPVFFSYDEAEAAAPLTARFVAKFREAGVVVGVSTTQYGIHILPIFSCVEGVLELATAVTWLKQFLVR